MALRRNSNKESFYLDLTTCSDIIFTLLLFYILTQNFIPQTPLELPGISSLEQINNAVQQRVEISADGRISWNGVPVSTESLETAINKAASMASPTQVLIFAHRQSPAGVAIELLDHLRRKGLNSVAFAGTRPSLSEDAGKTEPDKVQEPR